ncbi:hypothetical protein O181_039458 [Austropuccinia psidii MF-1]|uniref:Uncharacterized protein n=1 Tax=Austropuccinia psidii MF-1 TaxID=1389203 RepID=A0A9Q3DDF8_9BASI|nr:hypothetical protein [Austropuccinia psidii MF-1]
MSPVYLNILGVPRSQPEDRPGMFGTRRSGSGHHGEWQSTQGHHSLTEIHLLTKHEPQTRGLEGYGSSSLAPPTPERLIPMEVEKKRFKIATHCKELGEGFQKVFLEEILSKYLMVITKGWNPKRKFKLLEKGEARIRENQAIIQDSGEQLNQKEHNLIPLGSQGVNQPDSPVASNHSSTSISISKSQHSSQSQGV